MFVPMKKTLAERFRVLWVIGAKIVQTLGIVSIYVSVS